MTSLGKKWGFTEERRQRYDALVRVSDLDALHDLLIRHGTAILDRDLPYLVVAARNQNRARHRHGASRYEVPGGAPDAIRNRESLWDPLAIASAREGMIDLLDALAELDPRDVLVVWSHAAGLADEEIVQQWTELAYEPSNPSAASIRKRRERAREALRRRLELS